MSEELTPRQQILLWDLVSRGGTALRKDIKPEPEPADRRPLLDRKYISVSKEARNALRLTLEESGWNFLASAKPNLLDGGRGNANDRPILQFVLSRVQAYASQHGVVFADLFTDRPKDVTGDTDSTSSAIENAIREAFFEIAGRPARGNIRLSLLREKLDHLPKTSVDAALVAMWQAKKANLMNLDNPRDIEAESTASLKTGVHTFHVVRILE